MQLAIFGSLRGERKTMVLSLRNLEKVFVSDQGQVKAINDVTLEVKPGEFYSLLGPSGCGKTTTLRCIAGLETPSGGEIILDGEVVFSRSKNRIVPAHKRGIGMVFQSYAIWPHMNVFDNAAYPLRHGVAKRMRDKEIRDRVMEVLRLVQMDHLANRPATRLSGGQQQRVALARALSHRPGILLLDEPLSNLDAKLREEMRVELRDLLRQLGTTSVYVTHDQLEALAMSDRIGVMLDGRLIQQGTPHDIYLRPQHSFVANFVGNINFLSGHLTAKGPRFGSVVKTAVGMIHCDCAGEMREGQEVKVGIRPESITVIRDLSQPLPNTFQGQTKRVIFMGDFTAAEVAVGDHIFRAKTRPQDAVRSGDSVYVVLPPELCLVMHS